jgi:pimeloyl-ACP methyl ester carboxylesterase
MKRIFTAVGFLLALSLSGPGAAAKQSQPPGRLVDLGGHRLHVYCTGHGSPTVVVEAGLADFSFDWILVQRQVARFTRVCTYDRSGYAFSDPGPQPRTYAQINLELHDALRKLGERPPLVLVGHSFGGGVVRHYAAQYPDETAGIVLADAVSEEERIPMGKKAMRVRDSATGRTIPQPHEAMLVSDRSLRKAGSSEPAPTKLEPPFDRLPLEEQRMQLWAYAQPELRAAVQSEIEWSPEDMLLMHNTPQAGVLGHRPLIVLTRAEGGYGNDLGVPAAKLEQERRATQAELARLSTESRQIVIASGHNMELEAPDQVTSAIREVVEQVRRRTDCADGR